MIHPDATREVMPLFQGRIREQLTCLDRHFARSNYVNVNKEIADALSNLASV
jgi:hypothetical protein